MRIIIFISQLHISGGMEHTVVEKANFLSNQGHKVMFVTYADKGRHPFFKLSDNIGLTNIDSRYFDAYKYRIFRKIWYLAKSKVLFKKQFREIIAAFKPDMIDIITPNTRFYIPNIIKLAKSARVPIAMECHVAYHSNMSKPPLAERIVNCLFTPLKAIRKVDLLITLTSGDAECWRNNKIKNIKIIPNPIQYPHCLTDDINREQDRIICVGRLDSQKRFDRLIDSFALIAEKHPTWHIDIYGEGKDKLMLENQIANKALSDRIIINPPTQAIYAEYSKSQFLVLSSDYEGLPLVIIESMACETPVVACDCPYGPSDIIEDGITGLIAKMNTNDLANKMDWMISHEKERRLMGKKARIAAERYKSDIVMKEWEQAYLSIINNNCYLAE